MSRSNPTTNQIRQPISDRNYILPFGKYRGESLADIIDINPHYLLWLILNTSFELDHILQEEIEEAATGMVRA